MAEHLLPRLKSGTRALHVDLEHRVNLLNRVQTAAGYRTLLESFYGVYSPLESEIGRHGSEVSRWLPDVGKRMRTVSLLSDLRALGNESPEALPLAPIPPLGSLSEQFGCLYVLEGSTLGGQVIARQIGSRLNCTPANGCSFFASHGAEIGSMWGKFCQAIELYADSHPESHGGVIQSAVATFQAFGDWIERAS